MASRRADLDASEAAARERNVRDFMDVADPDGTFDWDNPPSGR